MEEELLILTQIILNFLSRTMKTQVIFMTLFPILDRIIGVLAKQWIEWKTWSG